MSKPTAAVILAAGKSTRMVTDMPKVLHEVCGRPMLSYVVDACRKAGIDRIICVVGYRKDEIINAFVEDEEIMICQIHLHGRLVYRHRLYEVIVRANHNRLAVIFKAFLFIYIPAPFDFPARRRFVFSYLGLILLYLSLDFVHNQPVE